MAFLRVCRQGWNTRSTTCPSTVADLGTTSKRSTDYTFISLEERKYTQQTERSRVVLDSACGKTSPFDSEYSIGAIFRRRDERIEPKGFWLLPLFPFSGSKHTQCGLAAGHFTTKLSTEPRSGSLHLSIRSLTLDFSQIKAVTVFFKE